MAAAQSGEKRLMQRIGESAHRGGAKAAAQQAKIMAARPAIGAAAVANKGGAAGAGRSWRQQSAQWLSAGRSMKRRNITAAKAKTWRENQWRKRYGGAKAGGSQAAYRRLAKSINGAAGSAGVKRNGSNERSVINREAAAKAKTPALAAAALKAKKRKIKSKLENNGCGQQWRKGVSAGESGNNISWLAVAKWLRRKSI